MSDTTVTVSDEDESGDGAIETATVDSVREQGKAEGEIQVRAEQVNEAATEATFSAQDAARSADVAAQSAEATANAALTTAITGAEVQQSIADLRTEIQALRETFAAAPRDLNGDGVPDPVLSSEVDPNADQEPERKGNFLNRRWGRKKGND